MIEQDIQKRLDRYTWGETPQEKSTIARQVLSNFDHVANGIDKPVVYVEFPTVEKILRALVDREITKPEALARIAEEKAYAELFLKQKGYDPDLSN